MPGGNHLAPSSISNIGRGAATRVARKAGGGGGGGGGGGEPPAPVPIKSARKNPL